MLKIDKFKELIIIVIFVIGIIIFILSNVSYHEMDSYQNPLKIIECKGINNQGCSIIHGKVLNNSSAEVSQVEVIVTLFDSGQKEIYKTKELYDVELSPNDTYEFKVSYMKKDTAQYDIQVNGKTNTIQQKNYWNILGHIFYDE